MAKKLLRDLWDAAAEAVDMSTEARMARAKEQGFDVDTTYYHGSSEAGFDRFDPHQSRLMGNADPRLLAALGAGTVLAGGLYSPESEAMFLGPLARKADLKMLEKAKNLAKQNTPREDILKETGWFQGVDGKWRFEIDDSRARVIPTQDTDMFTRVGDVLEHEGLYENYPDLRWNYLRGKEGLKGGGSYMEPDKNQETAGQVTVDADDLRDNPDAVSRTLLHELQHGVQGIEDFARGGSPGMFSLDPGSPDWVKVTRINDKLREVARGLEEVSLTYDTPQPGKADEFSRLKKEYSDLLTARARLTEDPYEQYRKLAGETESRNVETRIGLGEDQRKAFEPWTTADVPEADQTVRGVRSQKGSANPALLASLGLPVAGGLYAAPYFMPDLDPRNAEKRPADAWRSLSPFDPRAFPEDFGPLDAISGMATGAEMLARGLGGHIVGALPAVGTILSSPVTGATLDDALARSQQVQDLFMRGFDPPEERMADLGNLMLVADHRSKQPGLHGSDAGKAADLYMTYPERAADAAYEYLAARGYPGLAATTGAAIQGLGTFAP